MSVQCTDRNAVIHGHRSGAATRPEAAPPAGEAPVIEDAAFFERLVDNGSDAIISIDAESQIVYANDAAERVFGYEPAELEGEPLTVLMPDRFHDQHHNALGAYLETGVRNLDWNSIELPAEHRDGHEIPLSITFEEHEYDGETVFSGIMRDISERRAYERTLRALQTRSQQLMRARDREEIAQTAVDAAQEVLDLPVSSVYLYDETSDVLRPTAHTPAVLEHVGEPPVFEDGDSLAWRAFESGEPEHYEDPASTETLNRDTAMGAELIFPLGEAGVLIAGRPDPGEFDSRTVELAKVLAASVEAAMERASRTAELQRQNERLEQFASILSHDLRDPLNAAGTLVALARDEHDSEFLEELEDTHGRMETLIEDVLTLTRQGQSVADTESVSLRDLAENAWTTAGGKGATLEVDEDVGTVEADPTRLRTLFENLFGNALRHAGESPTVRVGRLEEGTGFYVADNGPGIPEAVRDEVFAYGYTDSESGTGLGLNIVQTVAEAHGWDATITSSWADGARFEFYFADTRAEVTNGE